MNKIKMKPIVATKFLGFISWLLLFMITSNMIVWEITEPTCILFIMISVGGLLLLIGVDKTSLMAFGSNVLQILQDENLTFGQRNAVAREVITKSIVILENNLELENLENQKNLKNPTDGPPEPPN